MTVLRAVCAIAISAALAPAALAQAKGNITHFTPANVVKALTELGIKDATARKQSIGGGQTVDIVSFSNGGLKHSGLLNICSAKGCLGLQLLTIWGDSAAKSISRTALNNFNANYSFGKGFVGPNNTLVYSRYAISDGGISVDNLKSNIANFATGSIGFVQALAKSSAGTEASVQSGEAAVHSAAQTISPEVESVILQMGESQGLNALAIQSPPVPDAPVSKPAQ